MSSSVIRTVTASTPIASAMVSHRFRLWVTFRLVPTSPEVTVHDRGCRSM